MDSRKKLLFPLLSLFVISILLGQGSARYDHHFHFRPSKLFVFGDSYVDTGNINANTSSSRKFPYGITFPGVPSGRFSDGRLLTDFFDLNSKEFFLGAVSCGGRIHCSSHGAIAPIVRQEKFLKKFKMTAPITDDRCSHPKKKSLTDDRCDHIMTAAVDPSTANSLHLLASYVGLKSPLPFSAWQKDGMKRPKFGINFAFGGTGVFDTSFPFPNMTTQIDLFQNLIANSIFTSYDIHSSFALVSPSGNDYSFYLERNGTLEGFKPFVVSVVNQIAVNLKRIHSLGVKKIVVLGLGATGCLPSTTAPLSFKKCNATLNSLAEFHNLLLKQAVEKLNNETKEESPFFILDIYGTILSIIKNKGNPRVGARFETPLTPCCFGVSSNFSCGSVDANGNKMYTLCKHPKSALFWDTVHPTQEGWFATFNSLKSVLKHHL